MVKDEKTLKEKRVQLLNLSVCQSRQMGIRMNILFIHSQKVNMNDIIWALCKLEVNVEVYPKAIKIQEYNEEDMADLKAYMEKKNYDNVITYDFNMNVAEVCRDLQIKYISWIFDSPDTSLYTDIAQCEYNYVFVMDKMQYARMKKQGLVHVFYLPLAANVDRTSGLIVTEEDEMTYNHDISFVGSLYQENGYNEKLHLFKPETKERFAQIIQNIALHWGKGYECFDILEDQEVDRVYEELRVYIDSKLKIDKKYMLELYLLSRKITEIDRICVLNALAMKHEVTLYTKSDTSALENVNVKGGINYDDVMPKIFYLSKINLNITLRSIETGIPLRVFDIMSVGGFVMSNYQEELEELFVPDKEIVLFKDIPELLYKVDYYLSHEEERLRIAMNGYKKVRECYDIENAVSRILKIVNET